jgi:hypothetical protein
MSLDGPLRTFCNVRHLVAIGGKADTTWTSRHVALRQSTPLLHCEAMGRTSNHEGLASREGGNAESILLPMTDQHGDIPEDIRQ